MKEDVGDTVALAQCKYTEKDSIVLRLADLRKVHTNAAAENRLPYMELFFRRQNPLENLRVYVVFEAEFDKFFPQGGEGCESADGFVLGERHSGVTWTS